jgi:hypothetical protein
VANSNTNYIISGSYHGGVNICGSVLAIQKVQ